MDMNNPDLWVVVEISGSQVPKTYHRVLAGWHGGFLTGDSWRISSGVVAITSDDDFWLIHNHSGSIYRCHKNAERMNMLMSDVLNSYIKTNNEEISLNVVDIGNILEQYKGSQNA